MQYTEYPVLCSSERLAYCIFTIIQNIRFTFCTCLLKRLQYSTPFCDRVFHRSSRSEVSDMDLGYQMLRRLKGTSDRHRARHPGGGRGPHPCPYLCWSALVVPVTAADGSQAPTSDRIIRIADTGRVQSLSSPVINETRRGW